jgi:hypothetical protein
LQKWIILLFFFFLGLYLLPVKLYFRMFRLENKIRVNMRVKIAGISFGFTESNPLTKTVWKLAEKSSRRQKPPEDLAARKIPWKRVLRKLHRLRRIIRPALALAWQTFLKISRPVQIRDLQLITELGWRDAAHTALAAGVLWSAMGMLYNGLQSAFSIKQGPNRIAVIPHFDRGDFLSLDYSCIFAFRLGHIIIIIYHVWQRSAKIRSLLRRVNR